jgi:hypothetical protein
MSVRPAARVNEWSESVEQAKQRRQPPGRRRHASDHFNNPRRITFTGALVRCHNPADTGVHDYAPTVRGLPHGFFIGAINSRTGVKRQFAARHVCRVGVKADDARQLLKWYRKSVPLGTRSCRQRRHYVRDDFGRGVGVEDNRSVALEIHRISAACVTEGAQHILGRRMSALTLIDIAE